MAVRKKSQTGVSEPVWSFKSFNELSFEDYHDILRLRGTVFASDDEFSFDDVDGLDPQALHLTARLDGQLVAYARIMPRTLNGEALIGRMVVAAPHRKSALAKALLHRALDGVQVLFDPQPVCVAAPEHAKGLYEGFGFQPAGDTYVSAGVPHVAMRREPMAA